MLVSKLVHLFEFCLKNDPQYMHNFTNKKTLLKNVLTDGFYSELIMRCFYNCNFDNYFDQVFFKIHVKFGGTKMGLHVVRYCIKTFKKSYSKNGNYNNVVFIDPQKSKPPEQSG